MKDVLFDKYINLIRRRASEYSEKCGVDYEELESQGFLIYCECLEKYDCTKSNFCTYLYIQLNRLGDFARTYNRQKGELVQDYYSNNKIENEVDYEQKIESIDYNLPSLEGFLKEAEKEISLRAYQLLKWIVGKTWERKNKRKPTVSMAVEYLNLPRNVVELLWNECKNYWNNKGMAYYS
jgi:hypothetical protein